MDSNENKSILSGKCSFVIIFMIIINNEIGINGITFADYSAQLVPNLNVKMKNNSFLKFCMMDVVELYKYINL